MTQRLRLLLLPALALVAGPSGGERPQPNAPDTRLAQACAAAANTAPENVRIDRAEAVAPAWRSPPSQTSPDGERVHRPFCRIAGTIEGDIGIEIWLPAPADWNRRLLGAGVGGEAGYFNYADMARGVDQGFVTASSDTGHKQGERWIDDPRKTENYAHRAYHLLTIATKAIAAGFYGSPVSRSYFIGCSGGGRQGLREMQLHPADYDGMLIGAPGQDVPLLAARFVQVELAQRPPAHPLSGGDWTLIADRGRAACDAQDGLADGVADDPRQCRFSVRDLQCRSGQTVECLSSAKLMAAEAIISPLRDRRGHAYDFGLLPGITVRPGGMPPLPNQLFGLVAGKSDWAPEDFDIGRDLPAARARFATMDARDADLAAFAARGGRLILYHGWADASIQPQASIDFHRRLKPLPGRTAAEHARLYMVPGMQHCRGGNGTDRFGGSEDRVPTGDPASDMLTALIAWVERGEAPHAIEARRIGPAGGVDRTRPLCPFPQRAVYRGTGDVNAAASFTCTNPRETKRGQGD